MWVQLVKCVSAVLATMSTTTSMMADTISTGSMRFNLIDSVPKGRSQEAIIYMLLTCVMVLAHVILGAKDEVKQAEGLPARSRDF